MLAADTPMRDAEQIFGQGSSSFGAANTDADHSPRAYDVYVQLLSNLQRYNHRHVAKELQMLITPTIVQIPVLSEDVFAFRIIGEIEADDLKSMAETMNAVFDVRSSVSMMLIFDPYEGAEIGAGLDLQTLTSQFRSITKVEKYAVVGAPTFASTMIKVMDKIIPTDARSFSADEEGLAWAFVGTRPVAG